MTEPRTRSGRVSVLIVEDEVLLALRLEALVEGLGYEVVGPAGTLERAQDLAGKATVDAALLDVNLGDETVFPLAQSLLERGVPIAFATAQARSLLPEAFRSCPCLEKPVTQDDVKATLMGLLDGPARRGG